MTFHHHEVVGARMTRDRMQALRYSNDDVEAVTRLVELHLRFHTYQMGWTDAAVRRYVRDAGDLLGELNVLTRCDCTTRNERKAAHAGRPHGRARGPHRRSWPRQEELKAIRPELDGNQVMERLGVAARARSWARPWPSCSSCAWTRACSARRRPAAASTRGGPPAGRSPPTSR